MLLLVKLSLLCIILFQGCVAPPVTQKKTTDANTNENEVDAKETGLEDYIDYHRYLKEVVDALESDAQFREKLEKANESDIRSGKIAHELEFVSHKVRSKLDEIKRWELERLRHLANEQYKIENGLHDSQGKVDKEHIDHFNPHTFEIEDLKKLIAKSTRDLAEADEKRRKEFKTYEMEKEFEKQQKLKSLDEAHRAELEKQLKEQEEKHKKHEPLHHPGSKQQLEEVWEKQDHMEQQDFDPKIFFMMHDLDGNGLWDENEVKTLFLKELDKMYQEGTAEDDMRERVEEMERMREHVFSEVDINKDGFISYEEFLEQTKKQEFQEDKGWETLDQQKLYTDEEYKQFEKRRLEEIEKLVSQGMLPPQAGAPVYHDPRFQPQGEFPPQGHYQGQVPPGYQQQTQYHPAPGQASSHGQMPQYNQQQQQYNPGQAPQHPQAQPNQIPVQQNQLPSLNTNEVYVNANQQQQYQQQQQLHQQQQQLHQQQQAAQNQQNQNAKNQAQIQNNIPVPQVNKV